LQARGPVFDERACKKYRVWEEAANVARFEASLKLCNFRELTANWGNGKAIAKWPFENDQTQLEDGTKRVDGVGWLRAGGGFRAYREPRGTAKPENHVTLLSVGRLLPLG